MSYKQIDKANKITNTALSLFTNMLQSLDIAHGMFLASASSAKGDIIAASCREGEALAGAKKVAEVRKNIEQLVP